MRLRRVALQVDIKIVFPLARAGRPGFKPGHRHAVLLERHQDVVHRARLVGHRHDQADAVTAGGLRRLQRLGQADHREPGAVEGIVLDRMGGDVQAELAGGPFAGDAGPGRVAGGQPCAFRVARHRAPLRLRQVLGEPALALRQCLRMRQHDFDSGGRIRQPQQVMAHQQADFPDDVQRRLQQQVERTGDHAFAVVLHRDHAEIRGAGRGGVEHFVEIDARHVVDARAEELHRGLLAERPRRAQVSDALRRLERPASRHHFAPDGRDVLVLQRPGIGGLQGVDDLGFALWAKHRRAFGALELAHFVGEDCTAIEQGQQLAIHLVDRDAQLAEIFRCFTHN